MPEFSESTYVDIDIDVDEFLEECTTHEIQEVIEWLKENGNIENDVIIQDNSNFQDDIFNENLNKLIGNRWKLSSEDEETILRISEKLI